MMTMTMMILMIYQMLLKMSNQLKFTFPDTKYTFADFFSGCGGFSLGFIQAGMKCVSALEFNSDAAWTYWTNLCYKGWSHLWLDPNDETNLKRVKKWGNAETTNVLWPNGTTDNWLTVPGPMPCLNLFLMDITKLEPEEWMDMIGVRPGDIRVFVGGPPCQGFSTSGKREVGDERNKLPLRMIYYAKVCKPDYVLIENVPGLLTLGKLKGEKESPFVKWIKEAFNDAGYEVSYEVHNAADYGVPQNRKRVIFFAVRKGSKPLSEDFLVDQKIQQYVNVQEALGDLPPIQAGESYNGKAYGYNAKDGYVICPKCLKYNKENRTTCHNCKKELNNPIRGGVLHLNGMTMIDCKNKIDNDELSRVFKK